MEFTLYVKCVALLATMLCGSDKICQEDFKDCVFDGEAIMYCADDQYLEYIPSETMFCLRKGENYNDL